MEKIKTRTRFLFISIITFMFFLILNTNVANASENITSEDFLAKDTIVDGIIEKFDYQAKNNFVDVIISTPKMYELLQNTSLLKKNLQKDNFIYEYFYIKLPEKATSAVMDNLYQKNQVLQIVEINEQKYAKCEFTLALLYNNNYYCGYLSSDGMELTKSKYQLKCWGKVKFNDNNNNTIDELRWDTTIDGLGKEDYTIGVFRLESDIEEDYEGPGAGGEGAFGFSYDRKVANGNCYVAFYTSEKLGNTISTKPFGTLKYAGKGNPFEDSNEGFEKYIAPIEDKEILNNDYIFVQYEATNGLTFCIWNMKGDLVKVDKNVNVENKSTKIKLIADTTIIPENTVLETEIITNEITLNSIKNSLKEISTKYVTYDISLKSNNIKIQPNGKVKISFPIPDGYDKTKLAVYRLVEDGTKTKYDVTIEGEYAIIETDHFSTYVIAENNLIKNNPTEDANEKINTDENTNVKTNIAQKTDVKNNNEEGNETKNSVVEDKKQNTTDETKQSNSTTLESNLDQTPKTGNKDILSYVIMTMIMSGVGIVFLKSKE